MRLIKNTTELIGIKDPNIIILLFLKRILISRFKQNWIILYTKLLFEVSIENPTKGKVYHDGHVRILYATSSKIFSKCPNYY